MALGKLCLITKRGDHTYNYKIQLVLGMSFCDHNSGPINRFFSLILTCYVVIENVLQANQQIKPKASTIPKTDHPSSTCITASGDHWHLDRYIEIIMEYFTGNAGEETVQVQFFIRLLTDICNGLIYIHQATPLKKMSRFICYEFEGNAKELRGFGSLF